jgi:hypothetical protein
MTPTHPTGITRLSGLFRYLSLLALILCVLIALTFLFATIKSSNEGRYTPYFLGGTLLPLLAFPIAFHFFRFFSRLRAGHRFDPATVSHLHNAGRWWLAFAAYDFALSLYGRFALQMTQLEIPLVPFLNASLILLTAWLLREAQLLQHDNELTV